MGTTAGTEKGFTAIEMLVVVTIISIFVAASMSSFSGLNTGKKVRQTALDLSLYLNKLRTCAATASIAGARVIFDNKNLPTTAYGVCTDESGVSRLGEFAPLLYDPLDPLHPQGKLLSRHTDIHISLLNAAAPVIDFPRSGGPDTGERNKLLMVSDAADLQKARHCCRIEMNRFGMTAALCSEFGCPR